MSYIETHMREALKDHILVPLEVGEKVHAYYLRKPGEGRIMSTLIVFTPEGIVLQGDLTPGRNGNVSTFGYGPKWFSGQLSGGYLCEKFLSQAWVKDLAVEGLRYRILEWRREGELTKAKARAAWEDTRGIPDDFEGPTETYRIFTEEMGGDGSECPGYGYDPAEAGWLCAIQERFAQLYQAPVRLPMEAAS